MASQSLMENLETLTLSQRLVRNLSHKLKKRSCIEPHDEEEEGRVSLSCLTLYGRGGGCRVGADTTEDFHNNNNNNNNNNPNGNSYAPLCGSEDTSLDCFSHGMREKFWKRNSKKSLEFSGSLHDNNKNKMNYFLPDDILEMCLMRLPLTTLMNARLVCKKWKILTTTPRFMYMRRENKHQSPWIFLFGVVKNGYCSGEIHILDVSLKKWHKLDVDVIKGRFSYSLSSFRDEIYVIGGCSSLAKDGKIDRNSFKTHKGVLVFSPLNRSWRKLAPMKYARSSPILGVFEINSDYSIVRNQQNRQERRFSRVGGALDVYEDPHRLSVRRQIRDENDFSTLPNIITKPYKFVKQKSSHSNSNQDGKKFLLIAVGGVGPWDEPLDSAEIYDSVSNKWMEIQRLPLDFGMACSGVVCNNTFYVYSETDKLVGYNIENGYWVNINTYMTPSRVHEYYPKLVCCNNSRLFMVSVSWCEGDGQIGRRNKAVRKVWELNLNYLTWGEVSVHPDAPMDWNAAFIGDKNMIFGVEMFKIFGQVLDFLTMCNLSGSEMNWEHISRSHVSNEDLDASSCVTKSMAVLHL